MIIAQLSKSNLWGPLKNIFVTRTLLGSVCTCSPLIIGVASMRTMRIFEHLKKMKVESNTSTIFYAIHLDKHTHTFSILKCQMFKMSATVFWVQVGSFLADVIKGNK